MGKLKYENIISLYKERKSGISIPSLCSKYKICDTGVYYLTRLIDKHGFNGENKRDILKKIKKDMVIVESL